MLGKFLMVVTGGYFG